MTTRAAGLLPFFCLLVAAVGCFGDAFDNPRFADGADGQDTGPLACAAGSHDGGDGVCRSVDVCSDGFHPGGGPEGACVPLQTCSDGFFVADDGTCAAGPRRVCGDGQIVPPEECDDGDGVDGDGCDSNCTRTRCGNGLRAGGEACDDGNAIDGDGCDDGCALTGCGNRVVAGSERCDDGNRENGDGCDSNCQPTACGNGIVTAGEICDDGNLVDDDDCDSNCQPTACGNGVTAGDEECDDGNTTDDDGCDRNCRVTGCGSGVVTGDEDCDDGNNTDDDGCDRNCTPTRCRNAIVTAGEACDDGNDVDDDGCTNACALPACGDRIVQAGEECDDGDNIDGDGCDGNCRLTGCGSGIVTGDEECDDGNLVDDDGCDANCRETGCGNARAAGREECDDGNDVDGDGCDDNCTVTRCGNAIVSGDEECDDGNLVDNDGCDGNCRVTRCGNARAAGREECDDGNNVDGDGCDDNCTVTRCGNGIVSGDEGCDDGNVVSGDGCRGDCRKFEVCGDAVVDVGEPCDDGNANPLDGCDSCREQGWNMALRLVGSPDGRAARDSAIDYPLSVAADRRGSAYIGGQTTISRLDPDGTVTPVAGTREPSFSGDGGPATLAGVSFVSGLAVDQFGRLWITDSSNERIRRVELDGRIITVAGTGQRGYSGDELPGTSARLQGPTGIAVDSVGGLLIADTGNHVIRRIDVDGIIHTICGTGVAGSSSDGADARSASLSSPTDVEVDRAGRIWIAEYGNNRVRRIDNDGRIRTILGGIKPWSISIDAQDRIIVTSVEANTVDRIEEDALSHQVTTVRIAGVGTYGFAGDGGPAPAARLAQPYGAAVDSLGRVLVADYQNSRIRSIDSNGTISTVVGNGLRDSANDESPALCLRRLGSPSIAVRPSGELLVADGYRRRVRMLTRDGLALTVAGRGDVFPSIETGPTVSTASFSPFDISADPNGGFVVADIDNGLIRHFDGDGRMTTIAGNLVGNNAGNGAPATSVQILPFSVFVDDDESVLTLIRIPGSLEQTLRRIGPDGRIYEVSSPPFRDGRGMARDGTNRLLVAASGSNQIYAGGTFFGSGSPDFGGDGGPESQARFSQPTDVSVDGAGRILIADFGNRRIRRIENGIISTIAGTGGSGNTRDGGPALEATLYPYSVAAADDGTVYVAGDDRVRRIDIDGIITTVAGAVHPTGPGRDGRVRLYPSPALLLLDDQTALAPADNGRLQRIELDSGRMDVVAGYPDAHPSRFGEAAFAPLLADPRGIAFDPVRHRVFVTEFATGYVRIIGLDPDDDGTIDDPALWTNTSSATAPVGDPALWTSTTIASTLVGPAGLVYDTASGTLIVVEEGNHCVRRIDDKGVVRATLFGHCGVPGAGLDQLQSPTQLAISPTSGALYIADTGNNRVLRIESGTATVVTGTGVASSAGTGAPARAVPVENPRQLAFDRFGNLYIASRTTIREVANVDGDADADADDDVLSIFGAGDRSTFPERDAYCLTSLVTDSHGAVYAGDACQGFLTQLTSSVPR